MDVFPVFFRMDDARVAVFGGGEEARRKVRLLARTPAEILVFSTAPAPDLTAEFAGRVRWLAPGEAARHLPGCRFAIIAEPCETAALAAFAAARAARVPVNRVDHKGWCDFTVPSILDRGRVVAAIATGGAAPVFARKLRAALEVQMPPGLAGLAELASGLRAAVRIAFSEDRDRRRFWEDVFTGPVADHMLAGDREQALSALDAAFAAALRSGEAAGQPLPVGMLAPPDGPADLITLRAFGALQGAEWLGHAAGTDAGLLDLARRDADRCELDLANETASEAARSSLVAAARAGRRCVVIAPLALQPVIRSALDAAGLELAALD